MSRNETSDVQLDSNELRDFVRETLLSIMSGVADVQKTVSDLGVEGGSKPSLKVPDSVNFDIAISASRGGSRQGGLRLHIFSGEIGSKDSHSQVSRVQFAVTCKIPMQINEEALALSRQRNSDSWKTV